MNKEKTLTQAIKEKYGTINHYAKKRGIAVNTLYKMTKNSGKWFQFSPKIYDKLKKDGLAKYVILPK